MNPLWIVFGIAFNNKKKINKIESMDENLFENELRSLYCRLCVPFFLTHKLVMG